MAESPEPEWAPARGGSSMRRGRRGLHWAVNAIWITVLVIIGSGAVLVWGGQVRFHVMRTGSMAPTLPVGAVVAVRSVPTSTIEVGDMLAFVPPDRDPSDMYIHRVKAISRDGGETVVVTQGDANPGPDPWTPFVISDANAWVVVFKVSHVGTMAGTLREFIGSSGMLASGGVIILVGCVLVLIWHPSRGRRQATASDDARSGVS